MDYDGRLYSRTLLDHELSNAELWDDLFVNCGDLRISTGGVLETVCELEAINYAITNFIDSLPEVFQLWRKLDTLAICGDGFMLIYET